MEMEDYLQQTDITLNNDETYQKIERDKHDNHRYNDDAPLPTITDFSELYV